MLDNRILRLIILLLALSAQSLAQRYNFEHYDIEDGLSQSQITSITQDSKRRLWVTTLGGISSFNGKQFSNYTKINGLGSNFCLSIAVGSQNQIYIGSARGLSRYQEPNFHVYKNNQDWISKLTSDAKGNVYALSKRRLFRIAQDSQLQLQVSSNNKEMITSVKTDATGTLWAAVYQEGIFFLKNNKWQKAAGDEQLRKLDIMDFIIDQDNPGKIWLIGPSGIHLTQSGKTKAMFPEIRSQSHSIVQDTKGAIWVGTNKGAYYLSPGKKAVHFNSSNGFTDNVVNEVFRDAEGNIWLGTDGSGLFRFTNDSYVTFDETQGVTSRIVMAIAKGPEPGTLWLGSYGGLYEYHTEAKISELKMPSKDENAYRINFLYHDSKNRTWIGTPGGGLWVNQNGKIQRVDRPEEHLAYNAIIEDRTGKIWLSTHYGVIVYDPVSNKKRQISKQFGGSLLEMGKDSIVSGTQDGPWLIVREQKAIPMNIPALNGSGILCMLRDGDHILFGTADYGLIIWNRKTGKTRSLNSKSGLAADHIYSLLKDSRGTIWVGTGKGINRLNGTNYNILKTGAQNSPLVECNQNAIIEYQDSIWIGTTKGVLVFGLDPPLVKKIKPYIFISSVSPFPGHQQGNVLPYNHNHISISYTGIHLSNPNDLAYQYRLIGLDSKYSQSSSSTTTNFTAIPAGKYTFQVRAVTRNGIISNTASFSFEILPPYYQTNTFRFFIVILIILVIMLAVYIILTLNERKRKLRLKIKLEEQFSIRKQTAEDFHDDLGNKLTRITVLSEVLSSMIDPKETEKRAVLQKIGKNVDELYTGTKDILWSLNPKNDTLLQLLNHIREFGTEMFNDTPVTFDCGIEIPKDTRLSLDMSRNILMIFKESIHNALKHAKAHQVRYQARLQNDMLVITLSDDGKGFDTGYGKNGHGINNMYVRAKRINADLEVKSDRTGTIICLSIKFTTLAHFKNV